MKRFFFLVCVCIAGAISSNAQTREALEDSVIVGGISRSLINLAMDTDQMKVDDKLMLHWTYAEFMKTVSREHLASFSDDELKGILAFYRTNAYRYLSSDVFYATFIENILKAMQYEMGADVDFSYALKDRSYGAGLKPAFENTLSSIRPIIDGMIGENSKEIANAKSAGIPAGHIELMKESALKVMNNLYSVYRLSVVDYLTKEDLKVFEDFSASDLGKKYATYARNVKASADVASEEFIDSFMAKLEGKKINNAQLRSSVVEYVTLSREFPDYFAELVRPYAELSLGDSRYQGEIRDARPYGKGKLTDKKGVVYEGNFKNGQRHGFFTVTKPGKQPLSQYWIADKYRKEVPVGKDKDGIMPSPYNENGILYGFGSVYDNASKSRYQGVFVDGQLTGQGKVYEPGRTVEGEFIGGKLVSGTITLTSDADMTVTFKGRMSGNLGQGIREWAAKDGSRKETHIGFFENGLLEGMGQRSVVTQTEMLETSGTFAFGKMYGNGVQRRKVEYADGMQESSVYDGEFFADTYHGIGRVTYSFTGIPKGADVFTRCYVKLPEFTYASAEVVMEGRFDNGNFVEGRISCSNGSWMEGQFAEFLLAQGKMRIVYQDGSVYQGSCQYGLPHGSGELYGADGSVFKGEFDYGEPVKTKASQRPEPKKEDIIRHDELKYEFNNISSGYGKATLIKPAGVKVMVRTAVTSLTATCKGRFKGETLIEGKVTMSDGTWLEGVFEDGVLIQGKGKTVDKYRVVYEGDIKNGFPHGNGKCFYSNGTWFEGKFAWGNRMGGTHYSATGEVIKVYE